MTTPEDWEWLRSEVRAAAAAVAAQIKSIPDTQVRVPNLEWSVADLGAHLGALPHLYATQNTLGPNFDPPTDWAAFSDMARAHITTTDAEQLTELIVSEAETLLMPDDPHEPHRRSHRPDRGVRP